MSYYHELYVVCDECHTSLLVDEATYEDADNDAAGSGAPDELERQGWRIDRDYPCDSLCPECAKPPRRRTPARPILISTKTRVEWASPQKGPNPQTERTIHGDNQPDPHDHHGQHRQRP